MSSQNHYLLSIVIPVYDEQEVLPEFHRRTAEVCSSLPLQVEFIYINDGSKDNTLSVLNELYESDERVSIVDLSRNFGKEIALTAGLHKANGDAVIVIDADLQDPPELIPKMISEWHHGYDVVYAKRSQRSGETAIKKITAHLFYRLMRLFSQVKIPEDTGDYRLLSRRAVDAMNTLGEYHRFMKGLFTWIGYKQKGILYERDPRSAGNTKWNYWRLWNFAIDGITSFTSAPLKFASYIGLIIAMGAFFYGAYIFIDTLIYGNPVPGYPSLIVIILFLGGIQLIFIGILGEYIGRIFNETKHRPLYFLNEYRPSRTSKKSTDTEK